MDSKQYVGRWVSPKREPMQNQDGSTSYLVRDFTLTSEGWQLLLSAFGDAESEESKLFTAQVEGHYRITGHSDAAGADEAEFDFEKITFTPYVGFFVDMLNSGKSRHGNWKLGESQDVSQTGVLFFAPVSQYPREYDLLKLDGENLYFGQRPADNNMGSPEKRPTQVTPNPVVKAS